MLIEKKIWPEFFEKVKSGEKSFEVRLADASYNPGDILVLREWDPKTMGYTGRTLQKKIGYVLRTKDLMFWPKKDIEKYGLVILSLK
jgi:hypothetical protein